MGGCYRFFKITIILLTLVQFGLGYTKVYQLFTDIGSSEGGGSGSFDDLAWLPYLFIQIFTTVFILLQVYFLARELCRDNFMYDYCFRCCFVLTTLNFLLVIFPKTIINLVYHTSDVSLEEWWTQIVDSLDSIFANLANLGFQIILYMRILKKIFACLRCCQQKISPIATKTVNKAKNMKRKNVTQSDNDANEDIETEKSKSEDVELPGCCLFVPISSINTDSKDDVKADDLDDDGDKQATKKNNLISTALSKKKGIGDKLDTNVNQKLDKVSNKVNQYSDRMKNTIGNKTQAFKKGVNSKLNVNNKKSALVCRCDNPVISNNNVMTITDNLNEIEETPTTANNEHRVESCETCGKVIEKTENSPNRIRKCYDSNAMMKCRTLCGLLENRPLCMKITLIMSCVHFLVYIVELVFIFI